MKIRLTPLNILVSALLVSIVYLLVFPDTGGWRLLRTTPLSILIVISFITDLIFRRFIKQLKRIWIVELVFIIFAGVLMMLIQRFNQ